MNFVCKPLEDCLDGSWIYEYRLDSAITKAFVQGLGYTFDQVEYFADFPRPFFRMVKGEGIQAKGVVGEPTFQVVFSGQDRARRKESFDGRLLTL